MHSNITVVNIDGRSGDKISTQMALVHSKSLLPGSKALMLSPNKPKVFIGDFEFLHIEPMGYIEYSLFIIYKLQHFIKTEFALIVQDDGWIINGAAWNNEFLNYDYIGAPSHMATPIGKKSNKFFRNYTWASDNKYNYLNYNILMNGGFSLRSKKILQQPSIDSLDFLITAPNSNPKKLAWDNDPHLEDVHLSIFMREKLEATGIKYPSMDLAKTFSIEHIDANFHCNLDLMNVFGHHSKFRKLISLNPPTIEYQINRTSLPLLSNEIYMAELFKKHGYIVKFLDE